MYLLGKNKELLWESFVFTTCSLKQAYDMHHEIHSQLSIHYTFDHKWPDVEVGFTG